MNPVYEKVLKCYESVKQRIDFKQEIALVLGSGLGDYGDNIEVVDTLDYLKMGGRCSSVAALGANLLKLHPRIAVVDGKMGVAEKYRGAIDGVIVKYAQQMLEQNKDKIVGKRCFVTHTKYNPEAVQKVCDLVKESGLFEEVIENTAGCVITSHCGPGTLGVLFEVTE